MAGNVSELKNAIQRACIMAGEDIDVLHFTHLRTERADTEAARGGDTAVPVSFSLEAAERNLVLATLQREGGNKRHPAQALGVSLKTLYNKLKCYPSH